MRRTSPGVNETCWPIASITTKSLPCPCIFAKRIFTASFSLVRRGLARRARLEAFVRPEILLGHLAHALLDEGVHARDVGLHVAGGITLPRRIKAHHVAVSHLARDDRDHPGAGESREPRQRRDGGGGHAEERREDPAPDAQVHVGQEKEGLAPLDPPDAAPQSFPPP